MAACTALVCFALLFRCDTLSCVGLVSSASLSNIDRPARSIDFLHREPFTDAAHNRIFDAKHLADPLGC